MLARILRGLSGEHEGAVFALGPVTSIGRSADADLQIIDPRISRRHAKIVLERGLMVLLDLASDNGTYVGEYRVVRHVLRPGDIVWFGETAFAFEEALGEAVTDPKYRNRLRSIDTLRQTVVLQTRRRPLLGEPRGEAKSLFDPTRLIAEALAETDPSAEILTPEPAAVPTTLPRTDEEILESILDFRSLQGRYVRGEHLVPQEVARFQSLRRVLRSDEAEARRYLRFACQLRAHFVVPASERAVEQNAALLDISAGGARLHAAARSLRIGQHGWLSLDLAKAGRRHSVVLDARVVWMSSPRAQLGLVFSGEARTST